MKLTIKEALKKLLAIPTKFDMFYAYCEKCGKVHWFDKNTLECIDYFISNNEK